MKKVYLLLFLAVFYLLPYGTTAQSCNILGCASSYGPITADATVAGEMGFGSCYYNVVYKQAYWEFFYSPVGGNFEQTFTPVNTGGDPLDIDYSVYDMGITGPSGITCPVNVSGFTEVICELTPTHGTPTGPGINGTVTTQAGHFYAVIIYIYQDADPAYTFNVGAPTLNGQPFSALNCPGVLPVRLSSFSATANGCKVRLAWQAQSELNLNTYLIEQSSDGRHFIQVGSKSFSDYTQGNRYSFDLTPTSGKLFYRLKMVDNDGKFVYSNVATATVSCNLGGFAVFPNPVSDWLTIQNSSISNAAASYSIFDSKGRAISRGTCSGNYKRIDFKQMPKGIYLVQVIQNGSRRQFKVVH